MGNFQPTIGFVSTKIDGFSFFEQLLKLLDGRMERPTLFGWYHLLCLAVTVGLCVLVFLRARNLPDKTFNLIIGTTALALILLEAYKQLNFSFNSTTGEWSYQWYAFPFQFCATPMYVLLVASLVPNGKVKDSLCAFMATYGLFAGAAVMFYPGDVFIETIGINIQTMIHHGMMVVIGVFMYVSGRAKLSHKTILQALPTFAILVGVAMTANLLYGAFGDPNQSFNMFYISPYYPCTLPVLSMFYGQVPYVIFLAIYVFGFSLAGYVMCLLAIGAAKLHEVVIKKFTPKQETL